jgi:hypothetical protein
VRKLVGWISVAIFLGSCALPLVIAHDVDLDCGASAQVTFAGGATDTLSSRTSGSTDVHCTLCHWLRAVKGSQTGSATTALLTQSPATASDRYAESSLGLLSRCDGPLRAPPAVPS